jgi:pilus assembly protein CpaE
MNPQTSTPDPFDLEYEAEDDFAPSKDDGWREASVTQSVPELDAFEALPPLREPAAAGGFDDLDAVDEPRAPNPVHEMLANAEMSLGETNIPRITIHAFLMEADTAEVVEKAAGDRRMEKAATTVHMGGLHTAVDLYQNQPTPSLVIVESGDGAQQLLSGLDRLAEVCDPGTKVVVVGSANDIALYRELMRRGVSEYLVPPLDPLAVIRAVGSLYSDPSAPFVGRQIAFCGAKGGSGSSTLAHNIAYSITERLHTGAVLVDLDLPFGTAGLDFNQDPLQGVADALTQPDRLDPVLMDRMMARCTERLSLFAAPATLEQDYEISGEAFEEVTQKIRSAAPFVVLDLPHVWTAWKRKILLASDDVIIVATPDLASLRNAKNMIDLVRRARPNDPPPRLVLNQVGVPGRPEITTKDFREALGVQPSIIVPFDPKLFGSAANNGQMLVEVGPKSKTVEAINELAQLISRRDPPPVQKTSLLSSLLKRK